MNILSLEAIHKQFADRPLLDGVTLGIEAGERVGVVGVNGSGKTTLLRIVAGAESSDSGRVSMTRDLRVAYLPQNPALDPGLTVIEQIFRGDAPEIRLLREYERAADALAHTPGDRELQQTMANLVARMDAASTWALENDARTILARLGITDLSARVLDLSGGQRKRVAMAGMLIVPADLLILDEPTNQIDIDTIAWLETFLARSTAALLLVTHDRYFLDRVAGRIVEVDNAKLYSYPGNYSRFLELKAERAEKQIYDESRRQTILRKELVWLRRGAQARTTKQQARIDRIATMQAAKPAAAQGALEITAVSRRIGKRVIDLAGVGKRYPSTHSTSPSTGSGGASGQASSGQASSGQASSVDATGRGGEQPGRPAPHALIPPAPRLGNLPTPLTPLINRTREVAAISACLARDDVHLITLVGPPGIGKTRLSLHVASAWLARFSDGVYFVALAPIRDPAQVLPTIAHTLGIKKTGEPTLDALRAVLSDRQVLLVLDNFEQVADAAPRIAELLRAAPKSKALVTSRAALHLSGEHLFSVPPLDRPDPRNLPPLAALAAMPAVELLISRMQAIRPEFVLTQENAPVIAGICACLDGLPLAIELAAARGRMFGLQALLDRLRSASGPTALRFLVDGPRDLLVHQQM